MKKAFSISLLCLLLLASQAARADYDAGLKAFEKGDLATALAEWTLAAEQNDARAQYRLGAMFDRGQGVDQNSGEALKWYGLAAEQEYADAEYSLGLMSYFGQGVPQDYREATRWFRLAVRHGKEDARYLLGLSEKLCDYP
ncbi:MAG: tetratricopeptide repeat protein [Syntrophobacter sp.]